MKKTITFIVFCLIWGIAHAQDFRFYEYPYSQRQPAQCVHAPEVPRIVYFAGDTLDMTRFDLRTRLDREVLAFTYMHSTTFLLIKRAKIFFPFIEKILAEQGVPDDFKYLALIESYLDVRTISPAKAAGIWQFMAATAQRYGLEVTEQVDERFHLEKATIAACQYLKNAYELYHDWPTVAAAYNAGTSRISTELEKQQVSTSLDLYLNEETNRYFFRMVAAKLILTEPEKYGYHLRLEDYYTPIAVKSIEVTETIDDLAQWAKDNGFTYAQLKDLNPWLRARKLSVKSDKTYEITAPDVQ